MVNVHSGHFEEEARASKKSIRGIGVCEFIANGESLALWIPMVQGEEGREGEQE